MTAFQLARLLIDAGSGCPWRDGPGRWRCECPSCEQPGRLTITGARGIRGPARWACSSGCTPLQVLAAIELLGIPVELERVAA